MAPTGERPAVLPEQVATGASVGAGACGALQPEVNGELGVRLDSSLLATLVNFVFACLGAFVMTVRRPATRRHLRAVRTWPVPWWTYLAGFAGVTIVLSGVITIETLGVAVFSVAFFAGQMASGLLIDGVGLSPGEPLPVTRTRVVAVAIAMLAVVLAQLGQPVGDVAPGYVVFVVAAGAASAFQALCNARIAATLGDALAPTTVNTVVGLACMVVMVGVGAVFGAVDAPDWPGELWLYTGGLFGVTIVLSLAAASASIGVLRATLAMLAAQLMGAFVVDWVRRDEAPTVGVLVGASLTVVAVLLVNRERARITSALGQPSATRATP